MIPLGDLPGEAVSSRAWAFPPTTTVPFRWTSATGTAGLGDLPGGIFKSFAEDVSADGSTIVGWRESGSGREAFLWTASGEMVGLGDLGGGEFLSEGWGISGDGATIVGRATTVSGAEAFIWDATNKMRSLQEVLATDFGLDLAGWQLLAATDITPDGSTIVGYGTNPAGQREAWLASLPEPSAILLLATGLAALAWRVRRELGS